MQGDSLGALYADAAGHKKSPLERAFWVAKESQSF
jgi:hypothetical protein